MDAGVGFAAHAGNEHDRYDLRVRAELVQRLALASRQGACHGAVRHVHRVSRQGVRAARLRSRRRLRRATRALNLSDFWSSTRQLFLQLHGRRRRRTAAAKDRLGKRPDNRVHGDVLPVQRPTIGNEVLSDECIVMHNHRGSMPLMNLDTGLDLIEIERTDRSEPPDARHPMHTTVGDHHVGPCSARAVEVSCRRDVCTSTRGEYLLLVDQEIAYCCFANPHRVAR